MRILVLAGLVAITISLAGCMCLLPKTHSDHSSSGKQKPAEVESVETDHSH